jgi:Cu+-exporting ATPase
MNAHTHDHHHGNDSNQHGADASADGKVIDPVCGMTVDPHTAQHRHTHRGQP